LGITKERVREFELHAQEKRRKFALCATIFSRNNMMLTPLITRLLIVGFFIILAGWAGAEIRAGGRDLGSVRPTGWDLMGRSRNPWLRDDPDATWRG
jgi:hypothetical protein